MGPGRVGGFRGSARRGGGLRCKRGPEDGKRFKDGKRFEYDKRFEDGKRFEGGKRFKDVKSFEGGSKVQIAKPQTILTLSDPQTLEFLLARASV